VTVARRLLRKSDTIYPKEFMQQNSNDDDNNNNNNSNDNDDDSKINQNDNKEQYFDDMGNEIKYEHGDHDDDDDEYDDDDDNYTFETDSNSFYNEDDNQNQMILNRNKIDELDETDIEENDDNTDQNEVEDNKSLPISTNNNNSSTVQKMPLPYKVAKSLDPVIYRNTAFDAWLSNKREFEEMAASSTNHAVTLQPGDTCFVRLTDYTDANNNNIKNNNNNNKWNMAHVNSITQDSSLVNVFVIDLGENHCVTLDNIRPFNNSNLNDNYKS
jgi:hypothetical protein